MIRFVRIAIAFIILIMLVACSKPSMRYYPAKPENAASLNEGELLFRLRSTNITVLPRTTSEAKNSFEAVTPMDVCKPKETPDTTQQNIPAKPKQAKNRDRNAYLNASNTLPAGQTTNPENEKKYNEQYRHRAVQRHEPEKDPEACSGSFSTAFEMAV